MNYKLYWWIRKLINSVGFFFKKIYYRIRDWKYKHTITKSINIVILKTILHQILLSSLVVGVIYFLDYLIISITKITSFNVDLYKELLLGGMGIAGVILGLYCANIASVFSSNYSNVPKQLSLDFQNDIITNSSIKELLGYIVICILSLILCIAEIPITWVSLCILSLLTIRMVVVFSISGSRTYALSDTFRIADAHTNNINNSIQKLAKRDTFTSDISFQHHIQKLCAKDISALSDIAMYNLGIPANQNSSMCEFMTTNIVLIGRYWQIKDTIPHNSKWFIEKTVYPQWHTASHFDVESATRYGISINCTSMQDRWWFEDSLLTINQLCLDKLIKDSDYRSIIDYLSKLAALSSESIKSKSEIYWVNHIESILNKILEFIKPNTDFVPDEEDLVASLFDILASAFVEVLKTENKMLSSFNIEKVLESACIIKDNSKADTEYHHFFNDDTCDKLYRQIAAEGDIEKKRITPNWFIKQTVSKNIYTYLGELLHSIEHIIDTYIKAGQLLHENKATYCAAVFLAHCFEIISNCEEMVILLDSQLVFLEEMHFEKSYIWEQVTSKKTRNAISELNKIAPNLLIKSCGSFALHHWNMRERKPDFLGLCYNHLCEHLIRAIESNDYTKFESIYCDLFSLTFLYQEYIRANVAKRKEPHLQPSLMFVATDPFVEYGIISGLATLWGEFTADNRWRQLVQSTLKKFVESAPDSSKSTLKSIVQLVQARKSILLGVTSRGILHTGWEVRIAQSMASHEMFKIEYKDYGRKFLNTESKLLASFAGNLFHDIIDLHNTEDIFYVVFVNQYLENEDKYKGLFKWEEDIFDEPS